jgi:hypothetical protein
MMVFGARARRWAAALAGAALAATALAVVPAGPAQASRTLPTAPYIDMGSWPTPVLADIARTTGLRGFTLGFVTSVGCTASWFNAFDPRTGWERPDVNAVRSLGGDVIVSFGGASGIELAQACPDVASLTREYQAVVSAYALKYVDFDIEGAAVAEPASLARRSAAMAALQRANPGLKISLTLPVLPSGLVEGVNVVRSARDAGVTLDVVNIMAMDYFQGTGVDLGAAAIQAARSTFNQLRSLFPSKTDTALWAMIGVTPMLGENDDHSKFIQSDGRDLVAFANQQHLGLLSFWETTRDRNACTGALFQCTNIAQQPYEFSKIFAGYRG